MNAVVIGNGEIGRSLVEVFSKYHDVSVTDPYQGVVAPLRDYDVMLVAIPYNADFEEAVRAYQKTYRPKSTIIFSTVAIGTSSRLGAVHVPVEGRHPDLAESIRLTDKWLGGRDALALAFLRESGFVVKNLKKPEFTEFLKLRSTTVYGLNIEFARYTKKVCEKLGLGFEKTKEWDKWVNDLYHHFNMDWATRYLLDAPEGKKGGHCVTPNAKILNQQYPNEMVSIVAEEEPIKDDLLESEVEKSLEFLENGSRELVPEEAESFEG